MENFDKNRTSVEKEIFSLLEQLNEQQQKEFVWRCCVRSLPFLADDVNTKFWTYNSIDIDSIFNVLDLMSYGGKYVEEVIIEKISEYFEGTEEEKLQKIANDLSWAWEFAADIEDTFDELKDLEDEARTEIPEYMERQYPQSDDYFGSQDYYDFYDSVWGAFSVVDILCTSAKFFNKRKVTLQQVVEKNFVITSLTQPILDDLKATIAHQKPVFPIELYQDSIETLHKAMKKLKLARKVNLYKSVWNNNFEMDIEKLKERIYYIV